MGKKNKIRSSAFYLPILLVAILLDEILNNYFLGLFSTRPIPEQIYFYSSFLILQIIASPLQAGFSDFYCRKRSLIASLVFSAMSLVLIFFYLRDFILQFIVLTMAILLKGTLGNTLPLAWAGIADTRTQNYRFSLGLSTATIAIGYLSLIIIETFFKGKTPAFIIFILFICLIPIVWKKFFDLIDRKTERERVATKYGLDDVQKLKPLFFFHLLFLDSKSIWNDFIKSARFRMGIFGVYFPVEVSFYSTHALGVDLAIHKFEVVTISMIIGYLCGVCVLKYCVKKNDGVMIKLGYRICLSSFILLFACFFLLPKYLSIWTLVLCYFFYSFGIAFIVPSLLATLSKERAPHQQGKIYGLVDSTDTIALLLALITGLVFGYFLKPIYVVFFSCLSFVVSMFYYSKFRDFKKAQLN